MSKFTKEQRIQLKQAIIKEARELFSRYGYDKTSIQEITTKVSIAQGTFYHFFPSKAQLFFTLLEQEEQAIRTQLLNLPIKEKESPQLYMKRVLTKVIFSIEHNELLRELLVGPSLQRLMRRLPKEVLQSHIADDEKKLQPMIEHWKEMGITFTKDASSLASLLRSLLLLTTHREEIGVDQYEDTMKTMVHAVVEKIVKEPSR